MTADDQFGFVGRKHSLRVLSQEQPAQFIRSPDINRPGEQAACLSVPDTDQPVERPGRKPAARTVEIRVLDHIIVGTGGYFSFQENRLL